MASRKRSRYTVSYVPAGSMQSVDEVVLAYGEESARSVIENHFRGSKVRRVRKGDFVNCAHQGGWRTKRDLIDYATWKLGIEWPVHIKQTSSHGGQQGCHRARTDAQGRPYHLITVKSYLSAERAGEVLWHELRHAQQCEELAADCGALPGTTVYYEAYRLAYKGIRPGSGRKRGSAYRTRSWEVEARATEARNAEMALAMSAR